MRKDKSNLRLHGILISASHRRHHGVSRKQLASCPTNRIIEIAGLLDIKTTAGGI
jgi:hypothetical protein